MWGVVRKGLGWLISIVGGLFVTAKFFVDYTGRTTFFEDFEALRGRIKPVLDWLDKQPDIWFYGTQFTIIVVGLLIVFAPQIRSRLWPAAEPPASGVFVPAAHLGVMQRYEGTLAEAYDKLWAMSALVAQHARLCEASRTFYRSCGLPEDQAEITEITNLIMTQMEKFVVPLPVAPQQGLRIRISWNTFLQIFDVPMRIPPKIKIVDVPSGVHVEVKNVTRLSFEVRFWPDHVEVTTFNFEADARL